ncbi:Uma2 family endonuclease [Catenulispora pinisilvae]|uniref:Uma2 family endonuclease n=1 Tax=Catenulispora pinisilvae TaxID=2705253 RepID=UPI001891C8A8|nr:Uma2 family endonuclease [Catenulispora pinisilvae]
MRTEGLPDWLIPPDEGFTAEDLDRIPDLPSHTQLIDGSLVFPSPQTYLHSTLADRLARQLQNQAPAEFYVFHRMTTTLAPRQRPEPDVIVADKHAVQSLDQTDVPVEDVLLVIEVVSRESEIRDRERKPQLYAAAGIPNFWRVEDDGGHVDVYVHELGPDQVYRLAGVHRDRLEVERPFPAVIDFSAIVEMFKED